MAAKTEFNVKGFLAATKRNQVLKKNLTLVAQDILNESKEELLAEFDKHPVTKEIEGGIGASNISNTLSGVDGNLFSFIGFEAGQNPTEQVRKIIRNNIKIRNIGEIIEKRNGLEFLAPLKLPSESEIEDMTPLPFEKTKSWLLGIEKGISGLGSFIAKLGKGRSLGGVQSKNELRETKFKPRPYFLNMFNKFLRKISSKR